MSLPHQIEAVAQESFHASFKSQLAQHVGGGALGHSGRQRFIHAQHFVDPDSPFVTTALTLGAGVCLSLMVVGPEETDLRLVACHQSEATQFLGIRPVGNTALGADPAQETLGDDPDQ